MTDASGPLHLFDTHVHVVSADIDRYPRIATKLANGPWWETTSIDTSGSALVENLTRARCSGAVVVQAAGAYGTDNRYLIDTIGAEPDRLVGVAIVDPRGGVGTIRQELAALAAAGVAGVRLFHIPTPDPVWLGTPVGDDLIDAAAALGLTVSVCVQAHDLAHVAAQLESRPEVEMVLDHCGFADFSGGAPFDSAVPLWELAAYPNLIAKFTPTLVAQEATGADGPGRARAMLGAVAERFGPDRVVLATDWPQHREVDATTAQPLSYAQTVQLIIGWTDGFRPNDRLAMLSGNAERLYRGAKS